MIPNDTYTIAVFFDIENLARVGKFKVDIIINRLLEKGSVIVKKAYADWANLASFKRGFHESAVELIDMPGSKISGKNSADIKMVVDALEFCYTKPHIDAYALVTGDSDFSPLVSKLRENGKHVIGIGIKESSSHLLIDNCDEFIFYEDLVPPKKVKRKRSPSGLSQVEREAFDQLLDAAIALQRQDKTLHSSSVKEAMKRKQPQFSEEYHGYTSFSKLLEHAEKQGLIKLRTHASGGTYVISEILDS
jgi:uncharacterized protein (TIGR00288 family)